MRVWTPAPGPTSGEDKFVGDATNDTVNGGGRNDTLYGNGGDDWLEAARAMTCSTVALETTP